MSLIYCPECGHEISNAAIACPSCGRPINAVPPTPVIEPVVVTKQHSQAVPPWMIAPIAVLGAVFLMVLFYLWANSGERADSNLNVNVAARRVPTPISNTRTVASTDSIPSDPYNVTSPSSGTSVPSTGPAYSAPPITVPGTQASVPTKGRVVLEAKITGRNGTPQAVKNARFYLLDKDIETLLREAGLEAIEGQSLTDSIGLAMMRPDRYGSFYNQAVAMIRRHAKYSGTTDGGGKAQISEIEPDSYYLFAITRTSSGYAVWTNPVSIIAGDNNLNLSPQPVTEISNYSEE
jgi:hypothetical protein